MEQAAQISGLIVASCVAVVVSIIAVLVQVIEGVDDYEIVFDTGGGDAP